jgi:putative peptidoglycan binding protein
VAKRRVMSRLATKKVTAVPRPKARAHDDWRVAKALDKLEAQLDALYPNRKKGWDGDIGDAAHKGRKSDHNPNEKGVVRAIDLTHDPRSGMDADKITAQLMQGRDQRLRYVIWNKRIFGNDAYALENKKPAWTWHAYSQAATMPHDHHFHISAERDESFYDDDREWRLGPAVPADEGADEADDDPLLRKGDDGEDVKELQELLGIAVDGDFGKATDRAVREFQRTHDLQVDGVVGGATWKALRERLSPPGPAPTPDVIPPTSLELFNDPDLRAKIMQIAEEHEVSDYKWKDRGRAPVGYVKGMALSFANVIFKYRKGHPACREMARPASDGEKDAIGWYERDFRKNEWPITKGGEELLVYLFAFMLGLGMRESSGKFCEGRDMSAGNTSSESAEAGLFQMSYDARAATPYVDRLMNEYGAAVGDGFMSVFREGVTCTPQNLKNYGFGKGLLFQQLCKTKPDFCVESAAVVLRNLRRHWGPINRREVELLEPSVDLFRKVRAVITKEGVMV